MSSANFDLFTEKEREGMRRARSLVAALSRRPFDDQKGSPRWKTQFERQLVCSFNLFLLPFVCFIPHIQIGSARFVNDLRKAKLRWPIIVFVCQQEFRRARTHDNVNWAALSVSDIDRAGFKKISIRNYMELDGRLELTEREWWHEFGGEVVFALQ